jgi:DNA-binding NarL/FixJ family response regulator
MAVQGRSHADALAEGWVALREGAWARARECFERALALEESPEALEGLGWVGACVDDEALTFDARERAYRRYRERGDDRSAARVASWLATDSLAFRGQAAVASGWLARAHRLLDELETEADHGWLAFHEGSITLGMTEDTAAARELGARAAELGRRFGVPELEMLGLGLEGRALVTDGDLVEGMRRLDEATTVALAGEATILFCASWACCYLIAACERVRDFERAAQWCVRVGEFCERHGIGLFLGICRTHYGGVLTWEGRWQEADSELSAAVAGLAASRPAMGGDALARLGELRRRQGRLAEAEELFARCESHALAVLGRAAMALDQGRPQDAAELADRYLRRFPEPARVERCAGLEVAVQAYARMGELDRAGEAAGQLAEIATRAGIGSLRAAVPAAEGLVQAAGGDHDSARRLLEDAVDQYAASDAGFDVARVRVELASTLRALGRDDAARRELKAALAAFRELGASGEAARAEAMLGRLRGARSAIPEDVAEGPLGELSRRELEVLALVAEGLTNEQIAERLVLSAHTVHRHVTNILRKLGLPSRAAAASLASRHGLV